MGPPPRKNVVPAHPLAEEALVKLYRLFRDEPELKEQVPVPVDERRYLALAEFWIESRGNTSVDPTGSARAYSDARSTFAARHTARAGRPGAPTPRTTRPCSRSSDRGPRRPRDAPLRGADRGGARERPGRLPRGRAAVVGEHGLPAHVRHRRRRVGGEAEGFGRDYVLPERRLPRDLRGRRRGLLPPEHEPWPSATPASSTSWSGRFYNGVLSGVSLEGDTYFYENPLESAAGRARWSWHRCPCCPPMFLKMMAALPATSTRPTRRASTSTSSSAAAPPSSTSGIAVEVVQRDELPPGGRASRSSCGPERPVEMTLCRPGARLGRRASDVLAERRSRRARTWSSAATLASAESWRKCDTLRLNVPLVASARPSAPGGRGRRRARRHHARAARLLRRGHRQPGPGPSAGGPARQPPRGQNSVADLLGGVYVVKRLGLPAPGRWSDWLYAPVERRQAESSPCQSS